MINELELGLADIESQITALTARKASYEKILASKKEEVNNPLILKAPPEANGFLATKDGRFLTWYKLEHNRAWKLNEEGEVLNKISISFMASVNVWEISGDNITKWIMDGTDRPADAEAALYDSKTMRFFAWAKELEPGKWGVWSQATNAYGLTNTYSMLVQAFIIRTLPCW